MAGGGSDEVRSVRRALALLDALAESGPDGVRVTDAAEHLGIDKSTASRLLATLAEYGYAGRLPNRRYGLGARSVGLTTSRISPLVQRAAPHLRRLSESVGETVYLLQLIGREAVTIARLDCTSRPSQGIEDRPVYPLWATAAGWALLSHEPPMARLQLLPREPYPAFTPRTPTTAHALWDLIRRGKERGVFTEEGGYVQHLSCHAAPLNPASNERFAIAISFESSRPEPERQRLGDELLRGARSLTFI